VARRARTRSAAANMHGRERGQPRLDEAGGANGPSTGKGPGLSPAIRFSPFAGPTIHSAQSSFRGEWVFFLEARAPERRVRAAVGTGASRATADILPLEATPPDGTQPEIDSRRDPPQRPEKSFPIPYFYEARCCPTVRRCWGGTLQAREPGVAKGGGTERAKRLLRRSSSFQALWRNNGCAYVRAPGKRLPFCMGPLTGSKGKVAAGMGRRGATNGSRLITAQIPLYPDSRTAGPGVAASTACIPKLSAWPGNTRASRNQGCPSAGHGRASKLVLKRWFYLEVPGLRNRGPGIEWTDTPWAAGFRLRRGRGPSRRSVRAWVGAEW